jgi:hypothetical protein
MDYKSKIESSNSGGFAGLPAAIQSIFSTGTPDYTCESLAPNGGFSVWWFCPPGQTITKITVFLSLPNFGIFHSIRR